MTKTKVGKKKQKIDNRAKGNPDIGAIRHRL